MNDPNAPQDNISVKRAILPPQPTLGDLDTFLEDSTHEFRRRGGESSTREGVLFENVARSLRRALSEESTDQEKVSIYKDLLERAQSALLSSAGKGHKLPKEAVKIPTPLPATPPQAAPRPASSLPLQPNPPLQPSAPASSSYTNQKANPVVPPPPPPPTPSSPSIPAPKKDAPPHAPEKSMRGMPEKAKENFPKATPAGGAPLPKAAASSKPPSPETPLQSTLHGEIQSASMAMVSEREVEEEFEKHMDYLFGGSAFFGKGKIPDELSETAATDVISEAIDHKTAEMRHIDLKDVATLKPYMEEASKQTGLVPAHNEKISTFIKRMIAKDLSRRANHSA